MGSIELQLLIQQAEWTLLVTRHNAREKAELRPPKRTSIYTLSGVPGDWNTRRPGDRGTGWSHRGVPGYRFASGALLAHHHIWDSLTATGKMRPCGPSNFGPRYTRWWSTRPHFTRRPHWHTRKWFQDFGPQNYGPHFTHTSALAVRKFWSALYPFTVRTSAGSHFTRRPHWHTHANKSPALQQGISPKFHTDNMN